MDVGKHIDELPKATPNNNPFHENRSDSKLVKSKSETLQTIHADYNRRIDALYAELKSCRDKLDEANQKLIDKTEKRSDKILELLESFVIRGE